MSQVIARSRFAAGTLGLALLTTTPAGRQAMTLTTDRTRYRYGELIAVTLANELSTSVLAPPQGSGLCSVVSLERRVDAQWVTEGDCRTATTTPSLSLGPRTVMRAALITPESGEPQRAGTAQQVRPAAPPVPSGRSADRPATAGGLTPEYPEGILNLRGLLYPSLAQPLSPGTYRVVFAYSVGSPTGPIEKTYTQPFEVTR